MKLEAIIRLFTFGLILPLSWAAAQTAPPAPNTPTPMAASAATAIPPMIPYSGTALDGGGHPLTGNEMVTFQIFKDEQGGEPMFAETQTVTADPSGQYKVQLGASLSNGIPIDLFASGEARWLEVQIAGQRPQPRVLLVSVPYAMKAADAAALGGLPASAYALAGSKAAENMAKPAITPDGVTTVTTTGGVSGHVAEFSAASAIVDSPLFVLGADVGIGTTTPTSTLDVNGSVLISGALTASGGETVNGMLELGPTGTATAARGFNSQLLKLSSSAYNSSSKASVDPRFEWQAVAHGNNTPSPSATLDLLSSTSSASATNTGFSFNANGTINFVPGQTFPGTGNVTSVGLSAPTSDFSVSGSPVTGAGTLGLNWKVAPTSADNAKAIVKRDSSGSFTAGAIIANMGLEGIASASTGIGVAGIHNGGGTAVSGVSLQAGGVGLYGDGSSYGVDSESGGYGVYAAGGYIGVFGSSTNTSSANADGVHGVTASALASGVAGVNNAGGVGVYGTGGTGVFGTGSNYGMVTDSNVQQARTAGGWVKAMVEVNPFTSPARIDACFNSTLAGAAAITPPCGIDLEAIQSGIFTLEFNFEVDDRFYSTQLIDAFGTSLQLLKDGPSTLETATWDTSGNLKVAEYQLIVY